MDDFWHGIWAIVFFVTMMNLSSFLVWRRIAYEPKGRGKNEKQRKRTNRIWLILLLILTNLPMFYFLLMIYSQSRGAVLMDVFGHNIGDIVFFILPMFNLGAIVVWTQFAYEPKGRGKNETKRKRANRLWLILLLIIVNTPILYMLLDEIYR